MKRSGFCPGFCCLATVALIWTGLLMHATSSAQQPEPFADGIPVEIPSFSCCEANIDFKTANGKPIINVTGKTAVVDAKRTLEIVVSIHLIWDCNPKADEPRNCTGKLTPTLKSSPLNTSGESPAPTSITITRFGDLKECPMPGQKPKSVNGLFFFHYNATYPSASPIDGTLEINLTLEPQTKGKIKKTLKILVKSKAGRPLELGPPTLVDIN